MEDNLNQDLLELLFKALKEKGFKEVFITRDSEDVLGRASLREAKGIDANVSDMNFALIYTKPKPGKGIDSELLGINSKLKVIPLMLLVGREEMDFITNRLGESNTFSKKTLNLQNFIKTVVKIPMFWARLDTQPKNQDREYEEVSDDLNSKRKNEKIVMVNGTWKSWNRK